MTPEQDERFVVALELAVGALTSISKTMELDYWKKYPPKREPSEPTITHLKTEEELIRESLGETGEKTVADWTSLDEAVGPRERAFLEEEARIKK